MEAAFKKHDRRSFLVRILKASGQVVLASSVVYSVGLVVKSAVPAANMTAGAKSCNWSSVFGGNEYSCSYAESIPACVSNGQSWYGCTQGGSPGIVEQLECYCN